MLKMYMWQSRLTKHTAVHVHVSGHVPDGVRSGTWGVWARVLTWQTLQHELSAAVVGSLGQRCPGGDYLASIRLLTHKASCP